MEEWAQFVAQYQDGSGATNPNSYMGNATVNQLGRGYQAGRFSDNNSGGGDGSGGPGVGSSGDPTAARPIGTDTGTTSDDALAHSLTPASSEWVSSVQGGTSRRHIGSARGLHAAHGTLSTGTAFG